MKDHLVVKRAMAVYARKSGIAYKDLTGLRFNNAWGDAARGLAWRVSGHIHEHHIKSVPQSTGCTARLLWALLPCMPIKTALAYVEAYWYSHRNETRYSYPEHSALRMACQLMPGVAPWTDCSGMIRCMWWQLNEACERLGFKHIWPDPAGAGYGVWGNSESFIVQGKKNGKVVRLGAEQHGDIACYTGGVGHAELVTKRGTVLTNGNDAGPYYKGIAQHSGKLTIVRLAPFV